MKNQMLGVGTSPAGASLSLVQVQTCTDICTSPDHSRQAKAEL